MPTIPNITRNLGPGMSGEDVTDLQNFLISQGFNIPAGATGYYGEQTKKAVSDWQKSVGVQAPANEYGYFGPKSMAKIGETGKTATSELQSQIGSVSEQINELQKQQTALQKYGLTDTSQLTQDATGEYIPLSGKTTDYDPSLGVPEELWNQLDDSSKAFVTGVKDVIQSQYDAGQTNVSINADLLNKAMTAAANDPDILSKYGDALKLNQSSLNRTLSDISSEYSQTEKERGIAQEEQRKALAESEASAGRAYSGFREQAKQRLATSQEGVIESSKRALQKELQNIGQTLEERYGTSGLYRFSPITAGGLSYTPVGGIIGTEAAAKKADIEAKGLSEYEKVKL